MSRLPMSCRPWACAIFAVSCRPMARLTWTPEEEEEGGRAERSRRGTEGEGVACEVSRSPEQGRRAQGERRSAAANRIG
jgi:hypothetical protein